jgi:hypothetical protein
MEEKEGAIVPFLKAVGGSPNTWFALAPTNPWSQGLVEGKWITPDWKTTFLHDTNKQLFRHPLLACKMDVWTLYVYVKDDANNEQVWGVSRDDWIVSYETPTKKYIVNCPDETSFEQLEEYDMMQPAPLYCGADVNLALLPEMFDMKRCRFGGDDCTAFGVLRDVLFIKHNSTPERQKRTHIFV